MAHALSAASIPFAASCTHFIADSKAKYETSPAVSESPSSVKWGHSTVIKAIPVSDLDDGTKLQLSTVEHCRRYSTGHIQITETRVHSSSATDGWSTVPAFALIPAGVATAGFGSLIMSTTDTLASPRHNRPVYGAAAGAVGTGIALIVIDKSLQAYQRETVHVRRLPAFRWEEDAAACKSEPTEGWVMVTMKGPARVFSERVQTTPEGLLSIFDWEQQAQAWSSACGHEVELAFSAEAHHPPPPPAKRRDKSQHRAKGPKLEPNVMIGPLPPSPRSGQVGTPPPGPVYFFRPQEAAPEMHGTYSRGLENLIAECTVKAAVQNRAKCVEERRRIHVSQCRQKCEVESESYLCAWDREDCETLGGTQNECSQIEQECDSRVDSSVSNCTNTCVREKERIVEEGGDSCRVLDFIAQ